MLTCLGRTSDLCTLDRVTCLSAHYAVHDRLNRASSVAACVVPRHRAARAAPWSAPCMGVRLALSFLPVVRLWTHAEPSPSASTPVFTWLRTLNHRAAVVLV